MAEAEKGGGMKEDWKKEEAGEGVMENADGESSGGRESREDGEGAVKAKDMEKTERKQIEWRGRRERRGGRRVCGLNGVEKEKKRRER